MKKFLMLLLCAILMFSFVACEEPPLPEVEKVEVTLVYGNGHENEVVEVEKGSEYTLPDGLSIEGFEFDGWYVGAVKCGATIKVDADITITAKYIQKVGTSEDLLKAVSNKNVSTIVLTSDIDYTATSNILIKENSITLDLNGKKLKLANIENKGRIVVSTDGSLVLIDSSVESDGVIFTETIYEGLPSGYCIIDVKSNGIFTMESGNIETVIEEDSVNKGQFAIGINNQAQVIIKGGKITAGWYTISGNGTNVSDQTSIVIEGGELVSVSDYAIYMPAPGLITINGGTVDGSAGAVFLRSGDLVINDGLIKSAGTGDTGDWSDGTGGTTNSLIKVESKSSYAGNESVIINGGKFSAGTNANTPLDLASAEEKEIKGGSFNFDPSEYVSDGYQATKNQDETYTVHKVE